MKIILSRKGFDSGAGGVASPILPDGRLVSLPIPQADGTCRYADVALDTIDASSLAPIVAGLSRGRVAGDSRLHLDPDLVPSCRPRRTGWRPVFGQTGAAQTHLSREGVSAGDLFLFFGWFRQVECAGGTWRYVRGAPQIHAFFGWLQVGAIYHVVPELARRLPWAADHPHLVKAYLPPNAVYVSADELTLPDGSRTGLPGAGVFKQFRPAHQLTEDGASRTRWRLPGWFLPEAGPTLSFHREPGAWRRDGKHVRLKSVARGQEFVFDASAVRKPASRWLSTLFA